MRLRRNNEEVKFAERVGGRIYRERLRRKMPRTRVVDLTHMSYSAVFRIEMGMATPSAFDIFTLSAALGIPVADLYPSDITVMQEAAA